jgi:hypothetical protein
LGRIVLFGGDNTEFLEFEDTWAWDGSAWTEIHPGRSPSARTGTAMISPVRGRLMLFGGFGRFAVLDDTWFLMS